MSWLDALLGKIRSMGVDVPLGLGLNFTTNLRAERNTSTGYVDVYVDGPQGPTGPAGAAGPAGATGPTVPGSTSIIVGADLQRAALTGAITASQNSNVTTLGAVGSTSIVVGADIQRAALTGAVTSAQNSNTTAFGVLAAKSVLANTTNTSAVPAASTGAAPRQYLRVTGANTGLEWSTLAEGVQTTAAAVSAATTVLPTTATYAISANTLGVGSRFRCEYTFQFIRGGTATALGLGCFFDIGGATISTPPASPTVAGTYQVRVVGEFTVLSTGAGGTAMATISIIGDGVTAGQAHAANIALAVNTTISNNIRGAAQMNAAVASTSITATGGHVMQLN